MKKVVNRKARFNYELLERLEAGVALTGAEVKSAKEGRVKLDEGFVKLAEDGAYLVNVHIAPYRFADNRSYNPTRTRRLLLHKKEILSLAKKMEGRGLTLVPVSCYVKRGLVKIEIALARGKKKWDKREAIKRRELEREAARAVKMRR